MPGTDPLACLYPYVEIGIGPVESRLREREDGGPQRMLGRWTTVCVGSFSAVDTPEKGRENGLR